MGLRRHQVENLVLRGPVFYWRARIPVGFAASARNARLSLSLRLSDRKKASLVARRLDAVLLQMEMMPDARMATKEQLNRIFALEIEAMRDEIEALHARARLRRDRQLLFARRPGRPARTRLLSRHQACGDRHDPKRRRRIRPRGIRINAVCPGTIDTPMVQAMLVGQSEAIAEIIKQQPIGRFGRAESAPNHASQVTNPRVG